MSTNEKRHKRIFTHKEKMMAIQRINDGETKASVSRDLNIPESTLRGWCKTEDKLRYMVKRLSSVKTKEPGDGQPPEKRSHTISHAIPTASNGNELKNPIAHQQPQWNDTYVPIELTAKSLHSPPLSQLRHPDPGAGVSMSASSPFSGPHPSPIRKTTNGLSFSEISTIMNFLSHPYGMSSLSATSKSMYGLQSPSPAQYETIEPTLPFQPPPVSDTAIYYSIAPPNRETRQIDKKINEQTTLLKNNHDTASSVPKTKHIQKDLNSNAPKDFSEKDSRNGNEDATSETPINEQDTLLPKPIPRHAETIDTKRKRPKAVRTQTKVSSVLNNLLLNNCNLKVNESDSNDTYIAGGETDCAAVEALENGKKFLAWLETCGDPRVTHMHVHQLRGLLNNLIRRTTSV